ncbi:hypothetical protein BST81_02505 [Leptolyngbya sp. 'hensonii']|uniref:hypothetical protein n=1 Tax=Leptolyngbya sp. 'hensonii' TaxID=1922337 RepID=UPI00094F4DDA|nr:hypothetical protein [Leptolyngbya sp. 'hensonii']OLP19966.1 hypothetical protein BST81_02505 [Leptolyngbya sp. 'hensonii']
MNKFSLGLSLSCALIGASLLWSPPKAQAESCNYFAGTAVAGQAVNVDLCSISRASARSVNFVYYLGNEKVVSQANCQNGTWTTFPEKQVHRPQSRATQRMLEVVCSYNGGNNAAFVFDPPSNVRNSPNGTVLCTINSPTTINIYGSAGPWYYTDVCGSIGVIHSSQLKF